MSNAGHECTCTRRKFHIIQLINRNNDFSVIYPQLNNETSNMINVFLAYKYIIVILMWTSENHNPIFEKENK